MKLKLKMNKTAKFAKNAGISVASMVAAGIGGAELADLVSDSESVISTVSTACQYVAGLGTFLPLHARDNKDLYMEDNKFKTREYLKDIGKMAIGTCVLEVGYIIGRPYVMYKLQKEGFDPSTASITSDGICSAIYLALFFPVVKALNIIREEKKD